MVKLDDIPEGQERIDLDTLADFVYANGGDITLIAVGEGMLPDKKATEEEEAKTGGLKLDLWTGVNFNSLWDIDAKASVEEAIVYEDGLYLTQKYTKLSGRKLREAMEKLGIDDTIAFGENFYVYVSRPFRSGYPRLIPVSKSDKKREVPAN